MKRSMVVFYSSDSVERLQVTVSEFLNRNKVDVINTSISSCIDASGRLVFSVAIAYTYDA